MTSPKQYGIPSSDEFLLRGIACYRRHAVLVWPFVVVGLFLLLFELRLETVELLYTDSNAIEQLFADRFAERLAGTIEELFWLVVLGTVILALLTAVISLLANGIVFLIAADDRVGRTRSLTEAAEASLRRLPALCVGTAVAGILVVVGLVLLVVPGVYLAVKFALGGPAMVIDEQGPIEGLLTSWHTVTGQFWMVFGVVVLCAIALLLVGSIPVIGELLVAIAVLPVVAFALAMVYLDSTRLDTLSAYR